MQSLIDEGRITEEEARTHPHRNLILKALDGVHDIDPDLFDRRARAGRPAPALQRRRLRRRSTTAGSPTSSPPARPTTPPSSWSAPASRPAAPTTSPASSPTSSTASRRPTSPPHPMLVGAAAELQAPAAAAGHGALPRPPLRRHRRARAGRAPRSPTTCRPASPFAIDTDPEAARYAPRAPRRSLLAAPAARRSPWSLGIAWMAGAAAWSLEPAPVLRRRAGRRGHDLPRRRRRPPGRRPLPRPTRPPTSQLDRLVRLRRRHGPRRHRAPTASTTPERTVAAACAAAPGRRPDGDGG